MRLDEEVLHLEPEASCISDTGTPHRPRKSYPGDECRDTVVLIELHCQCGRDLTTLDGDIFSPIMVIRFTIPREAVMDEDTIIFIECEETIGPSTDEDDRESGLMSKPIYLWKHENIISSRDLIEIAC